MCDYSHGTGEWSRVTLVSEWSCVRIKKNFVKATTAEKNFGKKQLNAVLDKLIHQKIPNQVGAEKSGNPAPEIEKKDSCQNQPMLLDKVQNIPRISRY